MLKTLEINRSAPEYLFVLVSLLGHARVSSVDMVLKQLVLAKCGRTHCTLVGQMGRLQGLAVVLGHMVQQLPLIDLDNYLHVKWIYKTF